MLIPFARQLPPQLAASPQHSPSILLVWGSIQISGECLLWARPLLASFHCRIPGNRNVQMYSFIPFTLGTTNVRLIATLLPSICPEVERKGER